jgi:hypothetical protein
MKYALREFCFVVLVWKYGHGACMHVPGGERLATEVFVVEVGQVDVEIPLSVDMGTVSSQCHGCEVGCMVQARQLHTPPRNIPLLPQRKHARNRLSPHLPRDLISQMCAVPSAFPCLGFVVVQVKRRQRALIR